MRSFCYFFPFSSSFPARLPTTAAALAAATRPAAVLGARAGYGAQLRALHTAPAYREVEKSRALVDPCLQLTLTVSIEGFKVEVESCGGLEAQIERQHRRSISNWHRHHRIEAEALPSTAAGHQARPPATRARRFFPSSVAGGVSSPPPWPAATI